MTDDLKKITVRIADTETTGFKAPPDGDMVEYAHTDLHVYFDSLGALKDIKLGSTFETLCNPGAPIHIEAMATHHITEDMVKGQRSAQSVRDEYQDSEVGFWAFHNANFDLKFFKPSAPVICTMKAAQVIFPDAPSFKLQVLRYWLKLDKLMKTERMGDIHRAGFDTYVTALLMSQLIIQRKLGLVDMANLQSSKILMGKVAFGKHRGTPWKDVPKSYLSWLVKNSQDEQVIATCKHYMK